MLKKWQTALSLNYCSYLSLLYLNNLFPNYKRTPKTAISPNPRPLGIFVTYMASRNGKRSVSAIFGNCEQFTERSKWLHSGVPCVPFHYQVVPGHLRSCKCGYRINTDQFPKRAPNAQVSKGVRGTTTRLRFFSDLNFLNLSWISESFRQNTSQFHSPRMKPCNLESFFFIKNISVTRRFAKTVETDVIRMKTNSGSLPFSKTWAI